MLLFYISFAEVALRLLAIRDSAIAEFDAAVEEVGATQHQLIYQYCKNVIRRAREEDLRRQEARQRNVDYSRPTIV